MTKKYLIIYHGNCLDGFTSAWIARNKLGESNCDFYPATYGNDPPPIKGMGYSHVFILDFSYKYEVMENLGMNNQDVKFIILDHHKTAQQEMAQILGGSLENVQCIFDMERSGCRITWDYFYAGEPVPYLVTRVEDRDLWRFKFSDTRNYNAGLFSYEYDFDTWDTLNQSPANFLIHAGVAIERKHFKDIKELLTVTKRRAKFLGYDVPVANLPYTYSSDAGHNMCMFPDAQERFAVCYWDTPTGITFSLRSDNNGMDVSAIAKHFGGGGHKNAASFSLTVKQYVDAVKKGDLLLYPNSPDAEFSNGRT